MVLAGGQVSELIARFSSRILARKLQSLRLKCRDGSNEY
jgi:hypothetical protein